MQLPLPGEKGALQAHLISPAIPANESAGMLLDMSNNILHDGRRQVQVRRTPADRVFRLYDTILP